MRSPLVWATVLSAVALSLAQPNDLLVVGNPFLALVGWVPLFWALRRSPSVRSAAGLGALFGALTTLLQDYWLAFFKDYAVWTIGGTTLGLAGYGALLGPALAVCLRRPTAWRPFVVGALWAVFEFLKSNGVLGFPWGLAPYPFHQWTWFFQIIDVTGLSFLTFLIVSWNAWLAEFLEPGRGVAQRSSGLFFASMTLAMAGYGAWKLNEPRPTRGTAQLVLVQQNGDPWVSEDDLGPLRSSVRHSLEAIRTGRPDLIVWSETSLRFPLQYYRPFFERSPAEAPLLRTIRNNRPWWLFGNPYAQDYPQETGWVNAAVLMNPQAQIVDYYGKIQQVPFAEHIPFWDVPFVKSLFQNLVGLQGSWDLGRQWTVFHVPVAGKAKTMALGTPICFEDAFPWLNAQMVREGAEVLVNLTNDSWSHRESAEYQHHVAALFRSVENRVYLVRSSNAGVTSVIDPTGQVVAGPLPVFRDAHLVFDLPLAKKPSLTAYTLFGDWMVALMALWVVLDLAWALRRRT